MARKWRQEQAPTADPSNENTLLHSLVSSIVSAIGGRAGILSLWDAQHMLPPHLSSYGLSDEELSQLQPLIDRKIPELKVVGVDQPGLVRIDSPQARVLEPAAMRASSESFGPVDLLALPLKVGDDLVGLVCLFQPADKSNLTAGDASYLVHVDELKVVIDNAGLLQRLINERQWLEAVVSSSSDGVLLVGVDGRVVGFNPAMERLTGWRIREAWGKKCSDLFHITGPGSVAYSVPPCLSPPELERIDATEELEVTLSTHDGSQFPALLRQNVIQGDNSEILGSIVTVRDLTAQKMAEELQSTFLSVVSHELQTPIAVIKGYAGILAEDAADLGDDRVKHSLEVITEESERLSRMVERLLYASQIQAGTVEIKPEPVSLAPILRRTAVKLSALRKGGEIKLDIPDNLPAALVDYEQIQEVVANLLENAIKYSPANGEIVLSARSTDKEVIVSVTDRGEGIPVADRGRIFERFSRLDGRVTRQAKGTGLGLYISKAIVEAQGGRIWVEDGAAGGTMFSFSVPREKGPQLPALIQNRNLATREGDL